MVENILHSSHFYDGQLDRLGTVDWKPPEPAMPDLSKMKITELIRFAEEQAKIERETPSLIDVDDPERLASWGSTLEALKYMQEHGVPASLQDEKPTEQ